MQGSAVHGSVHILVKTSNLSVSKVKQFLHSELLYTKFTLTTRNFEKIRAFARFKNEIWRIDLAYVVKLAKDENGVKYLLLSQDLFDGNVDAKRKKTKDSKKTVGGFLNMITEKNRPRKNSVNKGSEFAVDFWKLCKADGIQIYTTMSETEAAFAERALPSLENKIHC